MGWIIMARVNIIALVPLANTALVVYGATLAAPCVALALLALLRWILERSVTTSACAEHIELDPYETAYLAGGETHVVDTALAGLVHRGVLAVDVAERRLRIGEERLTSAHLVDQAVHSTIDPESGQSIREVRTSVSPMVEQIRNRLQELGLLMPGRHLRVLEWVGGLVFLVMMLVNSVMVYSIFYHSPKILTHLLPADIATSSPEKLGLPILLLGALILYSCVACFACTVIAGWTGALTDARSRSGREVLQRMAQRISEIALTGDTNVESLESDDLIMAMALFDGVGPADGALAALREALEGPADGDCDADGDGDGGDGFDAGGD